MTATYTPEEGGMFEARVTVEHTSDGALDRDLSVRCAKLVVGEDGYVIRGLRRVTVDRAGQFTITFGVRRKEPSEAPPC